MTTTTITTAAALFRTGDRVCKAFADRSDPANIGTVRSTLGHLVFVHWHTKDGEYPVHQNNLASAFSRQFDF
jgi:hypothetical protein